MTLNKVLPWVAVALVLVTLGLGYRACIQLPAQLKQAEAKYHDLAVVTDLQNHAAQAERLALLATIAEREASEATLKAKVAQSEKELAAARRTIAELQANEPPTTPAIEALPVVISLRAQVRAFGVALTAADKTISDQSDTILKLELDKKDLLALGETWKSQYDREHTLRVQAEDLFKLSERRYKLNKTVTLVAVTAVGAGIVYGLVRK